MRDYFCIGVCWNRYTPSYMECAKRMRHIDFVIELDKKSDGITIMDEVSVRSNAHMLEYLIEKVDSIKVIAMLLDM